MADAFSVPFILSWLKGHDAHNDFFAVIVSLPFALHVLHGV